MIENLITRLIAPDDNLSRVSDQMFCAKMARRTAR
jgi:hypothetical protein